MNIKIDDITQDDIQKAINLEAVKLSLKLFVTYMA